MMQKLEQLRARTSAKWKAFDPDVLPMHVAEMDFEISDAIKKTVTDLVSNSDLGYAIAPKALGPAFSNFSSRHWGYAPNPDWMIPATDVGVASVELLRVLIAPGEKVLVNTPVYSSFMKWIKEVGGVAVDAPLNVNDFRWQLDLNAIEDGFKSGAKVYLLCSPHNPVGAVHSKQDLIAIAEMASKYGVTVIADEIHAPLTFKKSTFTPYLSVSENARETGINVTSSSKSFNTAGLKGAIISVASLEQKKIFARLPAAVPWRASIVGLASMVAAFSESDQWISDTVDQIESNFELLEQSLGVLPGVTLAKAEATYLAWLDVSALGLSNPQREILKTARVSVVAGVDHAIAGGYENFIRVNIGTYPELVLEGVSRIAKLVK